MGIRAVRVVLYVTEAVAGYTKQEDVEDIENSLNQDILLFNKMNKRTPLLVGTLQEMEINEMEYINKEKMGVVLKNIRTTKDLKHKDFEGEMSKGYLSQLENGKCTPSMDKLIGWCHVTGVEFSSLVALFNKYGVITKGHRK